MSDTKTKFVVIENGALCCVLPAQPQYGWILGRSYKRIEEFRDVSSVILPGRTDVRPATRKDFEDFRVYPEGYKKDSQNYDFPTE